MQISVGIPPLDVAQKELEKRQRKQESKKKMYFLKL